MSDYAGSLSRGEQYWLFIIGANPVAYVSAAILPAWGFRRGIVTSGAESVVWLTDRAVGELVAVAALVVADVPVLCSIHAFGQAPARSRGIPFRHYPALVQVSCCSTLIFVVRVRQRGRCQRHRHQCAGEYYPSSEQARGGGNRHLIYFSVD